MRTKVKLPANRVRPPVDYSAVLYDKKVCGVSLTYTEFEFIRLDEEKAVMFDAFSAAHKYNELDVRCAVGAFPFYCGCMTDEGERVAFCGLRFGEDRAVRWELIGKNSALEKLITDGKAAAVPVSSGVCCISDVKGYAEYRKHLADGEPHPLSGQIILDGQTHCVVELYGYKYAVFSTGWGDGRFNCYIGYAADGTPAAIIVDFELIEYPLGDGEEEEVEIEITDDVSYVYDTTKSESENNLIRWTRIIESESDPVARLRAFSRRGYAYHSAGDISSALSDYTAAMECCRKVEDKWERQRAWSVYDNAAEIYMERSDYVAAISVMQDALGMGDEFNSGAYVRLIDLYQLTKNTDKALATAAAMTQKRPDDPVAHIKFAECCVATMDYAAAATEFGILASQFKLYENLFDQASCYIELGDHKKATEALERHPAKEQCEQYWYYKAYVDFKEKRFAAARDKALMSYELDREYMPALYLLIDIASLLQEHHAIARYAEEYKRLRPENEYGYSICAEAHLLLGNFAECARNYFYLYDNIKADDKYAALAAVVGVKAGEKKRGKAMLKLLRRKRSAYYYCALYCVSIQRFSKRADILDRILRKLDGDSQFLLPLSIYMLQTNHIATATKLIGSLKNGADPSYETVAQQIRIAGLIGDKKQFSSFFEYYIDKFLSGDMSKQDRRELSEKFMLAPEEKYISLLLGNRRSGRRRIP